MGKEIKLTPDAADDIENIAEYTFDKWGEIKQYAYLVKIYEAIDHISDNEKIGKERNDIKKGYRAYDINEYLLFYRILENHIDILGVTGSERNFKALYSERNK
ncbi:MAG: type II toxin-antitoxin system RelE/ParE family toxin [Cycloclasticus sp.]|nr:type II toxin-antitoxin system RelE/ParE family toxin [Cycloclasticus sp.]